MPAYKDDDGRWRYRFSFKGKRYSGTTPKGANTKRMAEQMEREHLERLATRKFTGIMPTVSAFIGRFLEHQAARVKPGTLTSETYHLRKHVEPVLGHMHLDRVGAGDIDTLTTRWRESAAATTINTRLGTAQAMFQVALDWGFIPSLPKFTYLKVMQETPRFLTEVEASALLGTAKVRWYSMVLVGLRTGLRIGELRGLQWGDIDFDASRLVVRRTDPGQAGADSTSPKGGRIRVLPLTNDARAALHVELERAKQRYGAAWKLTDWVWRGDEWKDRPNAANLGRSRPETTCTRAMEAMTARVKLDDVSWHTLRHTFASWLVMRGVSLRVVQELLGHASIRMTERYSHLSPGFAQHTAVALLEVPLVQLPALPELGAGTADEGEDDE